MGNKIEIFKNEEFGEIRTTIIDSEPWFVGKDIAIILGYSNPQKALRDHVCEEDKTVNETFTVNGTGAILINESGLYSLILSSKMPKAKEFKHWVTSEVLPSIRKHGVYAVDEVLKNPDMLIAALSELKAERERSKALTATVNAQGRQITEMKPKVSYYDVVLNSKDLISISVIAKDFGMSATKLNEYLHSKGVQYKQGKTWLLYQKYADQGYTGSKTDSYLAAGGVHVSTHTYWTQKGRLFIYNLLKQDGIMPAIKQLDLTISR